MSRLPRDLVIFGTVEISDPRFEVRPKWTQMAQTKHLDARSLNIAPHIAKPRDYRPAAQRRADVIGGSVPPVRLRAARRIHLARPSKAHQGTKERDGPPSSLDPSTPVVPNDDVAIAPAFAGLGA